MSKIDMYDPWSQAAGLSHYRLTFPENNRGPFHPERHMYGNERMRAIEAFDEVLEPDAMTAAEQSLVYILARELGGYRAPTDPGLGALVPEPRSGPGSENDHPFTKHIDAGRLRGLIRTIYDRAHSPVLGPKERAKNMEWATSPLHPLSGYLKARDQGENREE